MGENRQISSAKSFTLFLYKLCPYRDGIEPPTSYMLTDYSDFLPNWREHGSGKK